MFTWDGQRYLVDGAPLRSSTLADSTREALDAQQASGERPRILLSEHPALAQICRERGEPRGGRCRRACTRAIRVGQDLLGSPHPRLPVVLGRVGGSEAGHVPEPPDPFDAANPMAFIDWLNSSAEVDSWCSRFLHSIYGIAWICSRADLYGADSARYAAWVWRDGVNQIEIPELLPPRDRTTRCWQGRSDWRIDGRYQRHRLFSAELGVGSGAPSDECHRGGSHSHSTTIFGGDSLSRQATVRRGATHDIAYDVNVVCVNADSTPRFARDVGSIFSRASYGRLLVLGDRAISNHHARRV